MGGTPSNLLPYQVQTEHSLADSKFRMDRTNQRVRAIRVRDQTSEEVQVMEELPGCPACGAPGTVDDIEGPEGTVEVTCVAHHTLVGPRDLLAPKLRWDIPAQRLPMREELMFAPA